MDDGYDLSVVHGYLVVDHVPYVDDQRRVRMGRLVSRLDLAGDCTVAPRDHQSWFAGAVPCDSQGRRLTEMVHLNFGGNLAQGLKVDHLLCSRPLGREFVDYHEKVSTFVRQISCHAAALDPTATARTGSVVADDEGRSPFHYVDTATSRSGTGALAARLAGQSVGIIGLGGTGSYVLDFVSKTPVHAIHLFDDDVFLQHNAFRAPGSASVDDLTRRLSKVEYLDRIYSRLHRGIVPHRTKIGPSTYAMLDGLDFVFVCTDGASHKRDLVLQLEQRGLAFIDVGMGLNVTEAGLGGSVRLTTSTPASRDHVWKRARIPMDSSGAEDIYSTGVQVADLNALAASLAVIRWKRLLGFYRDEEGEHFSVHAVEANHLLNEDCSRVGPDDEMLGGPCDFVEPP
ncbi:ThiF family adenylyltransferase [Sphingomonas sp. IC-56]|nr:ThiF family adenylyltransferase [Sphingomonas sp. IC-56]